jgi:hypothetical protein
MGELSSPCPTSAHGRQSGQRALRREGRHKARLPKTWLLSTLRGAQAQRRCGRGKVQVTLRERASERSRLRFAFARLLTRLVAGFSSSGSGAGCGGTARLGAGGVGTGTRLGAGRGAAARTPAGAAARTPPGPAFSTRPCGGAAEARSSVRLVCTIPAATRTMLKPRRAPQDRLIAARCRGVRSDNQRSASLRQRSKAPSWADSGCCHAPSTGDFGGQTLSLETSFETSNSDIRRSNSIRGALRSPWGLRCDAGAEPGTFRADRSGALRGGGWLRRALANSVLGWSAPRGSGGGTHARRASVS